MKLRKLSILVIIALCLSIVPIAAAAASSAVTLNAISSVQPGGTVAIAGTSTSDEVTIKVLRPSNSTVFYDIVKVANGQFADSFTLGSNESAGTYTVVAGQADQVSTTTFVVVAPTPPPTQTLSSDANLSALTLSSGSLTPAFAPGTTSYSTEVPNDVTGITVMASTADSNATMTVNGAHVASGQASGNINLNVGSNIINVIVTAQNGTVNTYSVTVTRAQALSGGTVVGGGGSGSPSNTPPSSTLSSNANLSGLTLSSGTPTPAFAAGTTEYSASVTNSISSITVTASTADSNATMTVNGITVASGQASGAINLNVGTNVITIVVTAQDGTTHPNPYTITVTRAAATTTPTPTGGGSGLSSTTLSDTVTSTDGTLTLPVGKSGEVSMGDAIKITIPANASGKDLQLTITKLTETQKLLTSKDVLASPVFEILKNFSENFSKPITLTFAFDPKSVKDNQKPSVFYYDEAKKVWVEVGGKADGNHITVDVNHFTKYAVFAVDKTADASAEVNFSDISGHWAEANIKQAVSAGIVSGYPDGTFKPDRTVTRAEFAVMLMNALKPQGDGAALTFTDNAKIGAWAQKSVSQAVYAGIISGYEDSTFRPDAEITRPEMAVMIARATGQSIEANAATGFADDQDIPEWAKGAVASMKKLGIIEGKDENAFAPGDKTTRAEAVTVLLKMLAQKGK